MAATLTLTPAQRAIYTQILAAARSIGPFTEDPKKTSIHLTRKSAFAGVSARKDALQLTIKSAVDIHSPRIVKREQASANRWHLEIRLDDPKQVDRQLTAWLAKAMELAT
jgi:uncharacterized protein DUF5655